MLGEDEQRRVHAELAAAIDDLGESARHHSAAGNRARAHEKALLAAQQASTPGERAGHLAVAAANADGAEAELMRVEAARELIEIGEAAEAFDLVESLHPADTDVAAEAALLRSQAHIALLRLDHGRRELAAAESTGTTDLRLRIRIAASRSRLVFRDGDYEGALAAAEEGASLAESLTTIGPEVAGIYSVLGTARTFARRPGAREAHERALVSARLAGGGELELTTLGSLGFGLPLEGEAARAEVISREAIELARSLRLLAQERFFHCWHAGFAWHLGDPATAAAEAEAVLAEALAPADRELVEPYWWHSMNDLGRGEIVRPHIEGRVANAPPDDDGLGDTLWALADIELASGRPDAAERATTSYFANFGRASTFVGVVRAWAELELGKPPTPIPGSQLPLVEGGSVEVEALAALARGDATGAAALFDEAAALWAGRHLRGAFRCRWAAADALRRAGQLDEARARLLLIEPETERRQLQVTLRKIHRSLRLVGVRRAARRTKAGALTGREVEVLELVADGLTNDEIARRLGVGRPTVARLIRSAQQKLGAQNRMQAAALAARR